MLEFLSDSLAAVLKLMKQVILIRSDLKPQECCLIIESITIQEAPESSLMKRLEEISAEAPFWFHGTSHIDVIISHFWGCIPFQILLLDKPPQLWRKMEDCYFIAHYEIMNTFRRD